MFSNNIPYNNYGPIKSAKVGKLTATRKIRDVLDEDAEELTKARNKRIVQIKEDGKGGILDVKM